MRPKVQFAVRQCARFRTDTNLPHNQAVKRILKCFKEKATQELIQKLGIEKEIGCYVDAEFAGGCYQEENKYPGSVLSRIGYVITKMNCPIIWLSQIQIETAVTNA